MTDRLYYEDPYLLSFDAAVTKAEPAGDGLCRVWLDRSAFYPTSGGQPYDLGTVAGLEITDIVVEDGDVVHTVRGTLREGESVHCEIDAERRRDHMQQHCGEHMLAFTVWKRYNGFTHGLHIGEEFSSIDVTMPDGSTSLPESELIAMEYEINSWIQRDEPVHCWFPDDEELAKLPMRKASSVKEHIRIVHIAPDEYCACGGTHPYRTGEVGCIRILDAKPARGKMRLTFLCGLRAVRDNRAKTDAALEAAKRLSTGWQELPDAVDKLNERCAALTAQLTHALRESAAAALRASLADAFVSAEGDRVLAKAFADMPVNALREAAGQIAEEENICVLCAVQNGAGALLVFVRGKNCVMNVGRLLSETAKACGGKGGGRPDFAQGSAENADLAVETAKRLCGKNE